MFSDSDIAKGFIMSIQKVLYVVFNGLGPHLRRRLCDDIASSEGTFIVMFETMTV